MRIQIQTPIWNGRNGHEQVGINRDLIRKGDDIEVEILYKDAHGNKLYPDILTMPAKKVIEYHIRERDGHVPPLYIIPIKDFGIKVEPPKRVLKEGEFLINGEVYVVKKSNLE